MIAGLVLAAGAGRRFGSDGPKQLAALDGRPLLEHVLIAMSDAPLDRVIVVLGAAAGRIRAAVALHGAEVVECASWEEGQSASLRAGVHHLERAGAEAALVALGDQPALSAEAVARVLAARDPRAVEAVRATYGGAPGHPVLLERALFPRLAGLRGDEGARRLLGEPDVRVREVPCDGLGRPDDVDTAAQLKALRW